MKNILFSFVVTLLGISNLNAQWTQTDGPYGNSNVQSVFKHDSTYFVSLYSSGFFSKLSNQSRWNLNSDTRFNTCTIKGDSLFANAQQTFIGGNIRNIGIQLFDLKKPDLPPVTINATITAQTLQNSDTCLFGGNETAGFFKLSFDGAVLKYYNNGLPKDTFWAPFGSVYKTNVTAIELSDNYIFCGTKKGIFRSEPKLQYWNEINDGLMIGKVTFIENVTDSIYVSIDSTLYYSANQGNNWVQIYIAPSKITSFLKEGAQMFVSTSNNGIYKSSDNGTGWNSMNSGLCDLSVNLITKLDSVLYCGTNTKGVFKYQNGAWTDDNRGLISSSIRSIAVTNDKVIANDRNNVYKLEANREWSDISPEVDYEFFSSVNTLNDTLFLSVEYDVPNDSPFILFSSDDGKTWQNLVNPVPFTGDDPYRIYCENGRLYVYEYEIMYFTENLGLNWNDMRLPSQYCNGFNDFAIFNSQPFAAACYNGQLVKLDNSNNWILSNNGLPTDWEPLEIAFCDSAIFTYVLVRGMYVSLDNGNNWTYANNGLKAGERGITGFASYGNHLFVSTGNGIFYTSNYGLNWQECNAGLKNLNTNSLKILYDTLYVGTSGNGIWKRAINDIILTTSDYQKNNLDFKIYPNPAKEYFMIKLPYQNNVVIQIFDVTGRNILTKTVATNERINISDVPNGTYLITLKTKEYIKTNKLIINR